MDSSSFQPALLSGGAQGEGAVEDGLFFRVVEVGGVVANALKETPRFLNSRTDPLAGTFLGAFFLS